MLGLTKPSPMSSTPPPAGSTGTTTAGSTAPSEWSRPPNTSKPTTLPSTRRSSPHENGTKAVTLQCQGSTGTGVNHQPEPCKASTGTQTSSIKRSRTAGKVGPVGLEPTTRGLKGPGTKSV